MAHKGRPYPFAGCRDLAFQFPGDVPQTMPKSMRFWMGSWYRSTDGLATTFPDDINSDDITYEYTTGSYNYRFAYTDATGDWILDIGNRMPPDSTTFPITSFRLELDTVLISARDFSTFAWLDGALLQISEEWDLGDPELEGIFLMVDGVGYCGDHWQLC